MTTKIILDAAFKVLTSRYGCVDYGKLYEILAPFQRSDHEDLAKVAARLIEFYIDETSINDGIAQKDDNFFDSLKVRTDRQKMDDVAQELCTCEYVIKRLEAIKANMAINLVTRGDYECCKGMIDNIIKTLECKKKSIKQR